MWFIPKARSLGPGPITDKRASYRLCFSASRRKNWRTGVFRRCGNICRCICGGHSNVVGRVCRRGEEVQPIGWRASEIVPLINDCHSASAKDYLCKGVFDSVVPFGYSHICDGRSWRGVHTFQQVLECLRRHSMSRMCLLESEAEGYHCVPQCARDCCFKFGVGDGP